MSFINVVVAIVLVNIISFIMFGIDKWKAQQHKWRILESYLIGLALIGGSIGVMIGMRIWHHKTRHLKFKFGVPFIFAFQILVIIMLCSQLP